MVEKPVVKGYFPNVYRIIFQVFAWISRMIASIQASRREKDWRNEHIHFTSRSGHGIWCRRAKDAWHLVVMNYSWPSLDSLLLIYFSWKPHSWGLGGVSGKTGLSLVEYSMMAFLIATLLSALFQRFFKRSLVSCSWKYLMMELLAFLPVFQKFSESSLSNFPGQYLMMASLTPSSKGWAARLCQTVRGNIW